MNDCQNLPGIINHYESTDDSLRKKSLSSFNSYEYNQGRWSRQEHENFIEAIIKFGNDWKSVQAHIKTRSSTQARSHAQKFFLRMKIKNQVDRTMFVNQGQKGKKSGFSDDKMKNLQLKLIYSKFNQIGELNLKEKCVRLQSKKKFFSIDKNKALKCENSEQSQKFIDGIDSNLKKLKKKYFHINKLKGKTHLDINLINLKQNLSSQVENFIFTDNNFLKYDNDYSPYIGEMKKHEINELIEGFTRNDNKIDDVDLYFNIEM